MLAITRVFYTCDRRVFTPHSTIRQTDGNRFAKFRSRGVTLFPCPVSAVLCRCEINHRSSGKAIKVQQRRVVAIAADRFFRRASEQAGEREGAVVSRRRWP